MRCSPPLDVDLTGGLWRSLYWTSYSGCRWHRRRSVWSLVEGENADGVTVEDDNFDITATTMRPPDRGRSGDLDASSAPVKVPPGRPRVVRHRRDLDRPVDAAALRDALAAHKIENVMLVSAFWPRPRWRKALAALPVTSAPRLLFVEADTATLAVVDSATVPLRRPQRTDLRRLRHCCRNWPGWSPAWTGWSPTRSTCFLVGSGVDIASLKPQLEAVTSLPVSAPEEPETALAWGAALASASAPLFVSSTAALAYAQDPATGEVDPYAVSPGYLAVPDVPAGTELGEDDLAYSAVPDEEAEAHTTALDEEAEANTTALDLAGDEHRERRPLLLVGTVLAVVFVAAILALEVFSSTRYPAECLLRCCPGRCKTCSSQPRKPPRAPRLRQAPRRRRSIICRRR